MPEEEILSLPQGSAKDLIKKGEMTILSPTASPKEQSVEGPMIERARELLGRDFLGVEAVRNMEEQLKKVGVDVQFDLENVPPADWNEADLQWAKDKGETLILGAESMTRDGRAISLNLIDFRELFRSGDPSGQTETLFYSFRPDANDWYANEDFAKEVGRIKLGWRFVKKDLLEGSTSKTWTEQTNVMREYEEGLKKTTVTRSQPRRRTPIETAYDLMLYYMNTGERLLPDKYDWGESQSSDGDRSVCWGLRPGGRVRRRLASWQFAPERRRLSLKVVSHHFLDLCFLDYLERRIYVKSLLQIF